MLLFKLFVLSILSTCCLSVVSAHKTRQTIQKCCPDNHFVLMDKNEFNISCVNVIVNKQLTFTNAKVYDKNIHDKPINKLFSDLFLVSTDKIPDADDLENNYFLSDVMMAPHLSEDGTLYLDELNAFERFTPINSSNYCVDYLIEENFNLTENLKFFCKITTESPKETSEYFTAALLISATFLFLVLVVYMLLPSLRNLCGMILMAYVFSLLFAFLFLAVIQIGLHTRTACINLTTTTYFFFLASFCWMNVMSYDIWWTFRGYAKARPIHRRGETFKFLLYCIYGWGVPMAMSIAFVVINAADLSHMPWFVKPLVPEHGCFLEQGQKLVYLYIPMLILIICNWIFFLMTAFNIWRINRDSAMLDSPAAGTPTAHRNQKTRLFVYLKLSIIMGVNWILEVVSSFTPDLGFWYITDVYNLLIGLAIFLIFVCKKKTFKQLQARFKQYRKPQRSLAKSQTSCTTLSNSSQDTPLQVYHHPNGKSANVWSGA